MWSEEGCLGQCGVEKGEDNVGQEGNYLLQTPWGPRILENLSKVFTVENLRAVGHLSQTSVPGPHLCLPSSTAHCPQKFAGTQKPGEPPLSASPSLIPISPLSLLFILLLSTFKLYIL